MAGSQKSTKGVKPPTGQDLSATFLRGSHFKCPHEKTALQPSGVNPGMQACYAICAGEASNATPKTKHTLGQTCSCSEFYLPNLFFFLLFGAVSFSKSSTTSSNLLYGTKITYNQKHHTAGPTEANTRPFCS